MERVGLLFDLDGTLLDTLEDLYLGTNGALKELGLPPRTRQEVRAFVGNGARRLMELSLPGLPTDPGVDQALEAFQRIYGRICREHTAPYPGVLEALQQLRREGYPMAVVSNKPHFAVQELCDAHFSGLMTACQGETPEIPRKPAPDMVRLAAKHLGRTPERCIYIGDSEVDVLTARNACMSCLSVTWGFRDEELLRQSGATNLISCPGELPRAIAALEREL